MNCHQVKADYRGCTEFMTSFSRWQTATRSRCLLRSYLRHTPPNHIDVKERSERACLGINEYSKPYESHSACMSDRHGIHHSATPPDIRYGYSPRRPPTS